MNVVPRRFRQRCCERAPNTDLSGPIYVYLVATSGVDTPYKFDHDHEFLQDVPTAALVGRSQKPLSNVAFDHALMSADDLTGDNGNVIPDVHKNWQAALFVLQAGPEPDPSRDRLAVYMSSGFRPPPANGSGVQLTLTDGIAQF